VRSRQESSRHDPEKSILADVEVSDDFAGDLLPAPSASDQREPTYDYTAIQFNPQ
jgi:hypothetical protein